MSKEVEYGPDIRSHVQFGYGTYTSPPRVDNIKPDDERLISLARILGWSHGCPVAKKVTDPANQEYGPIRMIEGYSEVNHMFSTMISDRVKVFNPNLNQALKRPIKRLEGEEIERLGEGQVGNHEPESVPLSYLTEMAPMTAIYGYACPRVLIELDRVFEGSSVDIWHPLMRGALWDAKSLPHLLILLTNRVFKKGVKPEKVLQHTLALEVLEEENCRSAYIDLAQRLERDAPEVHRFYLGLSSEEKKKLGIAEIPSL